MTISQVPTLVVLGSSNVQVMLEVESQVTFDAVILPSPERRSVAVRLDMKSNPVISVDTVVPASPSSGSMSLIEGLAVDCLVVVGAAVVAFVLIAMVVTPVVTTVGAEVGTEETATCAIFTVYTFSIIARFDVSVLEFTRYPQDPSLFL